MSRILFKIVEETETQLVFHCPGCGCGHSFRVRYVGAAHLSTWGWNESMEEPTFSPSLLVNQSIPEKRCHLFIKDGMIEFLNDCHHELRGKTVPMQNYED